MCNCKQSSITEYEFELLPEFEINRTIKDGSGSNKSLSNKVSPADSKKNQIDLASGWEADNESFTKRTAELHLRNVYRINEKVVSINNCCVDTDFFIRRCEFITSGNIKGAVLWFPIKKQVYISACVANKRLLCWYDYFTGRNGELFIRNKKCIGKTTPCKSQVIQHEVTQTIQAPPIINPWVFVPQDQRTLHVMKLLVNDYHLPVNAAAGITGNFLCESLLLPNRIEGSNPNTPMRSLDFNGRDKVFSPNEVMNRNFSNRTGPRRGGIGIAQWTYPSRRRGLFQHMYKGKTLGEAILFSMEGQLDYFITELQRSNRIYNNIVTPAVALKDVSDTIAYNFMIPGSILDSNNRKLPRSSQQVQALFERRRRCSNDALRIYRAAHP